MTPKFKTLLILLNLEKLIIFFKANLFLFFMRKSNVFNFNYFFFFMRFFFNKQFNKILRQVNLQLVGNYTNNLIKSAIYFFFFNLKLVLINEIFNLTTLKYNFFFLFNLYFFSVKIVNTKINKKLYKNIFFYFLFFSSFF